MVVLLGPRCEESGQTGKHCATQEEARSHEESTVSKGGYVMAQHQLLYRTMTLEDSLQAIARLGDGYLLCIGMDEWTASDLLEWLKSGHHDLLSLAVALVKPDAHQDGAVYEVDLEGEPITDLPLYRIERRRPTVLPLCGSAEMRSPVVSCIAGREQRCCSHVCALPLIGQGSRGRGSIVLRVPGMPCYKDLLVRLYLSAA